jgi:hypothetical protein
VPAAPLKEIDLCAHEPEPLKTLVFRDNISYNPISSTLQGGLAPVICPGPRSRKSTSAHTSQNRSRPFIFLRSPVQNSVSCTFVWKGWVPCSVSPPVPPSVGGLPFCPCEHTLKMISQSWTRVGGGRRSVGPTRRQIERGCCTYAAAAARCMRTKAGARCSSCLLPAHVAWRAYAALG